MNGAWFGSTDLRLEPAAADQRRAAGGERSRAVGVAERRARAGRQAAGGEDPLARQAQFDPRHPRQQRAVGGLQAALEAHRDRRRAVARQLQRRETAVEGDDQVAVLGPLAGGQARAPRPPSERQQAASSAAASSPARPVLIRTGRT